MSRIGDSELILNADGSVYHLHLLPENIARTIILVGDQERVQTISRFFDRIEFKVQNREFVTHTGTYKGKRITVTSTGIGTDNIDIVLNEYDALVNIDFQTKTVKKELVSLNFLRIGTSGALQEYIPVDTPVVSESVIGIDGLLNFYANRNKICDLELEKEFVQFTKWNKILSAPYCINASKKMLENLAFELTKGITISAPGFYGPQGRILRLPIIDEEINTKLTDFKYNIKKITNYEMECSAIYGLSALMGHNALTVCVIVANRLRKEFSKDYKTAVDNLILMMLERIATSNLE